MDVPVSVRAPFLKLGGLLAIALAAVLLLSLADAALYSGTLVIETDSVKTLYSHEHDPGDSVEDPGHHEVVISDPYIAPRDLWISGMSGEIVNAPAIVLHHGELLRLDKTGTGTVCGTSAYGSGELLSFGFDQMYEPSFSFPPGYALFIPRGTPLILGVMMHNPLPPVGPGDTYRDVRTRVVLQEATSTKTVKPVTFHLLHLEQVPCQTTEDGFVFDVPANAKGYVMKNPPDTSPDPASYTFEKSGTIVLMGAHLHGWDGGQEIRVYKNGTLLRTFKTAPDPANQYWYDTPRDTTPLHVDAGDTLSIEAVYDNPYKDTTVRGAMAMLGFFFAEE